MARFPEVSKLTAMPRDIGPEEMTRIVKTARQHVDEVAGFEWRAWTDMVAPWLNSAAYSYSASTAAAQMAQKEGWKGY